MGSGGGKDPHFNSELEWIRFREDALGEYAFPVEGTTGKLSRKIKENPFVPLGKLFPVKLKAVYCGQTFNMCYQFAE